jgi:hypothetical protein
MTMRDPARALRASTLLLARIGLDHSHCTAEPVQSAPLARECDCGPFALENRKR